MSSRRTKEKKKENAEIPSVLLNAENELIERNYDVRKIFKTDEDQTYALCISPFENRIVLVHFDATQNIMKKNWDLHQSQAITLNAGQNDCLLKATESGAAGIGVLCNEGYCTYIRRPDMKEPVGKRLFLKSKKADFVGKIDNSGMYVPIVSFSDILDQEKTKEVQKMIMETYKQINSEEFKKEEGIFVSLEECRKNLNQDLENIKWTFSEKTNEIANLDRKISRKESNPEEVEEVEEIFKRDGNLRRAYDQLSNLLDELKIVDQKIQTLRESVENI